MSDLIFEAILAGVVALMLLLRNRAYDAHKKAIAEQLEKQQEIDRNQIAIQVHQRFVKEFDTEKKRAKDLEAMLATLRSDFEALQKRYDSDKNDWLAQVTRLEQDNTRLQNRINLLESQKSTDASTIKRLHDSVIELTSRVDELQQTNADLSAALAKEAGINHGMLMALSALNTPFSQAIAALPSELPNQPTKQDAKE